MSGREFLALEPESIREYLLSRKFSLLELYGLGLTGIRLWKSGSVIKKSRPIFSLYLRSVLLSRYQARIESAEVVVNINFAILRQSFLISENSYDLEIVDINKYNK